MTNQSENHTSYFIPQTTLNTLYLVLLGLTVFLAPSNLFLKIFESTAYVNGIFIDYLIPKLYLSDLPIILILGTWLVERAQRLKGAKMQRGFSLNLWAFTSLSLLLVFRQLFVSHSLAAIWYLFKLLEITLFGFFLITHVPLIKKNFLLFAFGFTLFFQSLLAIYQYFTQSTLFGYWFLGEPNLSNPIGLARITLDGIEKVLPYGTTAHPNILGGVLVVYLLILFARFNEAARQRSKGLILWASAPLLLCAFALYLTHSASAWLTLVTGIGYLLLRRGVPPQLRGGGVLMFITIALLLTPFVISNLATLQPQNQSLTRRAYLNNAAWQMFLDNPVIGVGLNNFTARVEEYSTNAEIVRFIQPVHHIGLLWLAETGIIGILLLLLGTPFFFKEGWVQRSRGVFLLLLPLIVLDHYLLTNQTGLFLLTFFMATTSLKSTKVEAK